MALDNQSFLNYSLLVAALLVWFILYRFLAYVLELPLVLAYVPIEGGPILPFLLAGAVAGTSFVYVRRNETINQFGLEVVIELKKVVWPTRKETTGTTTAVLILIFIVTVLLYIFDKILGVLLRFLVES